MKVSVIIPTYNEEKVIGKCLRSLDGQSLKDFEVILVDDGSTDDTVNLAQETRIMNYELRIMEQKHKGPGSARNRGVKRAKAPILVFVDADMAFDRGFLKNLIKPIEKDKSRGTFSKEEYVSNWDNKWVRCWNINQGWEPGKRHPANYPDTQKVFRSILKSEFDRVGGFDDGGHYTDDYLSEKLGYGAVGAKGAKFYHENPDNLGEVFTQARWSAKRKYKYGFMGNVYALLRASLPVSVVVGVFGSIRASTPEFLIFKIIYDMGVFVGILEYKLFNKGAK